MTIKPRSARALLDARAKLHAIAAAAHSASTIAVGRAADAVDDHQRRLDASVVEASASLAGARSVHDLDRAADTIAASRGELQLATAEHAEASARSDATASTLRVRSRQLKAAERIVDTLARETGERESRGEQRRNDDMAARRR